MLPRVEFSPSYRLAVLLAVVHGAALLALLAVLPVWAGALAGALLLANLAYYLLRDALIRLGISCTGLVADGEGVVMSLRNGDRVPCVIDKDSVVTPMLTVLNLRLRGQRGARSILILPDSLDAESFRELRVWLRWGDRGEDGAAASGGPKDDRASLE
jgi:toxin CptA